MRWGVYAEDSRIAECLRELQRQDPGTSFLIVRQGPVIDELAHGLPRTEFCASWEQLLVATDLSAVMVQGTSDDALAALRQLGQLDTPLYVWPEAEYGLTTAYELSLMVDERAAPIVPMWSFQGDRQLVGLRSLLQQEGCAMAHVEVQRTLPAEGLSVADLDRVVARARHADLALLRWLGVHAKRVTTLDSSRPGSLHKRLTITLDAEATGHGLWALELATGLPQRARLSVQSSRGEFQLEQQAEGAWTVMPNGIDIPPAVEPAWLDPHSSWNDAVEVFEWIDGVERSLKRRRTIELHNEPLSERAIFKSQMVAGGCGVLTATFALALLYLAIGETVPLPRWALLGLRGLVFAPLFLFLLAQLLLPLTRPAHGPRG